MWQKTIKHAFSMFYTLIKHGFLTNQSMRRVLSNISKRRLKLKLRCDKYLSVETPKFSVFSQHFLPKLSLALKESDKHMAIFVLCKLEECNVQVVVLLNQNIGSPITKFCSIDKSVLFPEHFLFFSAKCICCVWTCFVIAFVLNNNGFPLKNFARLYEFPQSPNMCN